MRTTIMRIPVKFKKEVDGIARSRKMPTTKFLEEDGTRIMRNAKALTDMLFKRRRR